METKEENFIPSIYNYCDRWCERCEYTGRCRLFSMENEKKENGGYPDLDNIDEVMKDVKKSFAETFRMIEEYAAKFKIDLSSMEEIPERQSVQTPLSFLAAKYFQDASEYLKKLREEIKTRSIENAALSALIPVNPGMNEMLGILECFEIIQWYHTMIPVKIERANSSSADINADDKEGTEFAKYDMNGSAQVAYKSILKSMTALGMVHGWTEQLKEESMNLIIDAGRIKNSIEKDFPEAL
ncbi:MAG TPA: hypothetical protein VLB50_01300, partial [Ignavibacteriaceae bacterium]|nr:hypothetical protein [Ignavibacteriaceae bacterium]